MALKKKIDKTEFEKLSKDVQANYTANGDHYLLDLEGDEAAELRRAKDREAQDAATLRAELKTLKEEMAALKAAPAGEGEGAKDKDVEKLTKAFDKKMAAMQETFDKAQAASEAKIAARDAATKKSMIDSAAMAIATKISTVPAIMAKTIAERFDVDFTGDEPKLVILGKDMKASALTSDQLSKEFSTNPDYAAIVVGSKGSGSGAPRNGTERKPPSGAGDTDKPQDLSKLAPKDLAAVLKERKEASQQT